MMKLFHTPASHFVRKCTVTIKELGLGERVEIITTKWPHSWGTETVKFQPDFVEATPIARIPALVTEDGLRLTESSLICEYLNDELGNFRLCPQSGRERWWILSVASVATSGVMESQAMRRAELLRKREDSKNKQESSPAFVKKMMDRQDRCYRRLDELSQDFRADIDLGQIAAGCACAISDFRFPEDDWRAIAPNLARWYDRFRRRPSMLETDPSETPFHSEDVPSSTSERAASPSTQPGVPLKPLAVAQGGGLANDHQIHYVAYLEPGSNLWCWTLYNTNNRMLARNVEKYYNKTECLAAIAVINSASAVAVREE